MMAWTEETGGDFSLVEHPMPPRRLAAPIHKHSREDEYSFVLEGRMGALLGDDVVYAEVGRPRVQAARPVAHVLERGRRRRAGSSRSSRRAASSTSSTSWAPSSQRPDFNPEQLGALGARYGLEFDPESVPRLCAEHGLTHPLLEAA